jgi:hypothetical protein
MVGYREADDGFSIGQAMIRISGVVLWLMAILMGCSPPAPTLTPAPIIPTPTLTPEPLPKLPTMNPDELVLKPNQGYGVLTTFSDSPPARVVIYEPYPSEQVHTFDLEAENSAAENLTFTLPEQNGIGWGMPYLLAALNNQPGRNIPASRSIQGTLLLSPDRRTIAYFLCNEHGGRGQWCYQSRLWLFDGVTGAAHWISLGDLGVLYIENLRFSADSLAMTGDSCLQYANAYFGHCGKSVVMTWEAATGRLLDKVIATSTPQRG